MAYSTLALVKVRLPERDSWTEAEEAELTAAITSADAIIDNALKNFTSVPLSPTPQMIEDISADMAAGMFERRRLPPNERSHLLERSEKNLKSYITATYKLAKKGKIAVAQYQTEPLRSNEEASDLDFVVDDEQ